MLVVLDEGRASRKTVAELTPPFCMDPAALKMTIDDEITLLTIKVPVVISR